MTGIFHWICIAMIVLKVENAQIPSTALPATDVMQNKDDLETNTVELHLDEEDHGLYDVDVKIVSAVEFRNALSDPRRIWDNATVPYEISDKFDERKKGIILDVMDEFRNKTCVRFISRQNEKTYIFISKGTGCSATLGQFPRSRVKLASGCFIRGTIIHELMHVLGFSHEQNRPDRDDFVKINFQNIQDNKRGNFEKFTKDEVQDGGVGYDYNSVMHYGAKTFTKNGNVTIETLTKGATIGQRKGFSQKDLIKINLIYNCGDVKNESSKNDVTQSRRNDFLPMNERITRSPEISSRFSLSRDKLLWLTESSRVIEKVLKDILSYIMGGNIRNGTSGSSSVKYTVPSFETELPATKVSASIDEQGGKTIDDSNYEYTDVYFSVNMSSENSSNRGMNFKDAVSDLTDEFDDPVLDIFLGTGNQEHHFQKVSVRSSTMARTGLTDPGRLWENGLVPYIISTKYDEKQKEIIEDAIEEFRIKSCVRFEKRNDETTYISIEPALKGCETRIGKTTDTSNTVSLSNECFVKGVILHELMHVLGFIHEQNRPDRDDYVIILWGNIRKGYEQNFWKYSADQVNTYGLEYDYFSLMHYGLYDSTVNQSLPTIWPREDVPIDLIGQRDGLSNSDITKLNSRFKCDKSGIVASEVEQRRHTGSSIEKLRKYCGRSLDTFFSSIFDIVENWKPIEYFSF